jgi:hypothetical protein
MAGRNESITTRGERKQGEKREGKNDSKSTRRTPKGNRGRREAPEWRSGALSSSRRRREGRRDGEKKREK